MTAPEHDEDCWRVHDDCALTRAADRLDRGEHPPAPDHEVIALRDLIYAAIADHTTWGCPARAASAPCCFVERARKVLRGEWPPAAEPAAEIEGSAT